MGLDDFKKAFAAEIEGWRHRPGYAHVVIDKILGWRLADLECCPSANELDAVCRKLSLLQYDITNIVPARMDVLARLSIAYEAVIPKAFDALSHLELYGYDDRTPSLQLIAFRSGLAYEGLSPWD